MSPARSMPGATLRWLLCMVMLAASCRADEHTSAAATCEDLQHTPVLFVHGSGLSSGTWQDMITAFVADGYPHEFLLAIDMRPSDGDNVRAARRYIAAGIDQLLEQSNAARDTSDCRLPQARTVDIVAHSMGAFSARWYIRFLGAEQVRTLIAIAGANHGTDRLCGRDGLGDRQMCPAFADDSAPLSAQRDLNGTPLQPLDVTPFGIAADSGDRTRIPPDDRRRIAYATVRIEPDEWIEPARSAELDGAGGFADIDLRGLPLAETSTGNFRYQAGTTHDGLPMERDLIRFVRRLLSAVDGN